MRYLLFLLLAIQIPVFAKTNKSMSFCFEEWTPYAFLSSEGKMSGHSIETIQKALIKQNIDTTFLLMPHSQCIERVRNNQIDFVLHIDKADGLLSIDYDIADWVFTLAVRLNDDYTLREFFNNNSAKISIARGYDYPAKVRELISQSKLKVLTTQYSGDGKEQVNRLFSMLTTNRVDALLIDKKWAELMIKRHQIPVKVLDEVLHVERQYIGYHKVNKFKAQILRRALEPKEIKRP